MIQVTDLSLQFSGRKLFSSVNIKFTKGNCYGIIGANGAGKSTFLKLLTGEIESTSGHVSIEKNARMSVLNPNQDAFNNETVLQTVLLGHKRLVEIMEEKDALYAKEDFTEEDGVKAGALEEEFMELDGWSAENNAETLLSNIGVPREVFEKKMGDIDSKMKIKVLLAQALFGDPDILILDEPTNNLDTKTIGWLEDYLLDFPNTVITVSHNRHFLNKVCTHTCDVDYGQIKTFIGNYDFWYESSQLLLRQAKEANKKAEARAKELQDFIARFSANASKSKQATSRKKELEKLTIEDIKPSSRKYPYVNFDLEREIGNEVLELEKLSITGVIDSVDLKVNKGDKIAFFSDDTQTLTTLFDCLAGKVTHTSGKMTWGKTVKISHLPKEYDELFTNQGNLIDWLSEFSTEKDITFIRSWLGRMLFSGEEVLKNVSVLSGGEKVRCMFAKTMLNMGNVLIFEEPTNHLDLESITALNKGMINYKSNIFFTSSDQELVGTVANRIVRFENGKKVFDKEITYEEYVEKYIK